MFHNYSKNILRNINANLYQYFGFDYSKIAISLASDYVSNNRFFFVADVNSIPLKNNSVDIILDILSPYNEKEVKRLLKKEGIFIKVSPATNYLKELRESQNMPLYNNEVVIKNNIDKQFKNNKIYRVTNTFSINEQDFNNLLKMTPINNKNYNNKCQKITIDLSIFKIEV